MAAQKQREMQQAIKDKLQVTKVREVKIEEAWKKKLKEEKEAAKKEEAEKEEAERRAEIARDIEDLMSLSDDSLMVEEGTTKLEEEVRVLDKEVVSPVRKMSRKVTETSKSSNAATVATGGAIYWANHVF